MVKNPLAEILAAPIVGVAEGIANVIDRFVQTPDEKSAVEAIKARIAMQPHVAQIELNKIEASHRSIFVAGWRPFIGWVCGIALAWHFVVYDLLHWAAIVFRVQVPPSLLGAEQLIPVVMSLLGLGGLRTFEKYVGKTK